MKDLYCMISADFNINVIRYNVRDRPLHYVHL